MSIKAKITITGLGVLIVDALLFALYLIMSQLVDSGDLIVSDDLFTGLWIIMWILSVIGVITFISGVIALFLEDPFKPQPLPAKNKKK